MLVGVETEVVVVEGGVFETCFMREGVLAGGLLGSGERRSLIVEQESLLVCFPIF